MSGGDTQWIKVEVIKAMLTDALQQAAQWPLSLSLSGGELIEEQVGGDDAFNDIISFGLNFFGVFPFNICTIIYEAQLEAAVSAPISPQPGGQAAVEVGEKLLSLMYSYNHSFLC